MIPRAILLLSSFMLVGCAAPAKSGPTLNCTLGEVLNISPAAATVNHSAKTPANSQQFAADITFTAAAGCAVPALALLAEPTWTSSDPMDVTISSANDNTNGTAVCNNSVSTPVTLTATTPNLAGTATLTATTQLTCQ